MKTIISVWVLLVSLLLVSCTDDEMASYTPELIKVGVLPDESNEKLIKRYSPFLTYLEKQTGFKYELVIPESYRQLLELFQNKDVDMAYFGAYTFFKAHESNAARPLFMRNVDAKFTSYVIALKNSNKRSLSDLENTSFTFGSKLSTSGHIMPRYYFERKKIIPEKYFSSISYSGSHDNTVKNVMSGEVVAGVANALIIENYMKSGAGDKLDIIWVSPNYADYVWVVQSNFSTAISKKIHDSVLQLSLKDNKTVLDLLRAEYFVTASISDFDELKEAVKSINE